MFYFLKKKYIYISYACGTCTLVENGRNEIGNRFIFFEMLNNDPRTYVRTYILVD